MLEYPHRIRRNVLNAAVACSGQPEKPMTTRPCTAILRAFPAILATGVAPAGEAWQPEISPRSVHLGEFIVPADLEVTVWASTPMVFNPTNIDIDHAGRIWVAEGVNYRRHQGRRAGGDRIAVLQDTDGDGKADRSHTFVQEPALVAPLGVAVFDNTIVVSQPPDLIVYTDVDRNLQFDPAVDQREVLLTGFNARNHDHSLHSVTAGPDGKCVLQQRQLRRDLHRPRRARPSTWAATYQGGGGDFLADHQAVAGQPSDDGHVWSAGFTARMNADGTGVEIIGHGYRNSYEQTVTSSATSSRTTTTTRRPAAPPTSSSTATPATSPATTSGISAPRCAPARTTAAPTGGRTTPAPWTPATSTAAARPPASRSTRTARSATRYAGSLFSCEPTRNTIFGYQPGPRGASFALERTRLRHHQPVQTI